MSKILRYLACLFMLIFAGNALAAGYSCPSYKKYTSCASGYYMTSSSSSKTCNTTAKAGNACRPCSVMGSNYTCAGGTSCPKLNSVTCSAGYYLKANATSCSPCGGNNYYCPGGTYNVSSSAQGRNTVSSGYYSTGGTSTTRTGQSACGGNNYYCSAGVRYTVSSGYYSTGGTSTTRTGQSQCTGATYCASGVRNSCPGSYTANTTAGKTSASQCQISVSAGKYIATANSSTQSTCAAGRYKAAHTVNYGSTSSCSTCGAGTYSSSGAASCTACSGSTQYQNLTGQSSCKTVSSGYYKSSNSAQAQCPSGYRDGAGAANQNSCVGSFTKTGSQQTPSMQTGCVARTLGTCTPGTCTYTKQYSGTIVSDCTPTNCTKPQTCTSADDNYYLSGGSAAKCSSSYPYSDGGNISSSYCYKYGTKTGSQVNGSVPTNCASVTSWNSCTPGTCQYKDYNGATDGTCTPSNCTKTPAAVTADAGYYDNGTSCSACPSAYPNSADDNEGGISKCYMSVSGGKYVATANATSVSTCAAGTYKAAHTVYYGSTSSCSACTGRTKYSAAGASACSTVGSGYYTTGCNTSGNNCTGQSQCTGATYCSSGVQNNCPSGYTANTTAGKTAASSCQISCSGGTYVATANAACTSVGTGYYRAAHTVNYGSTSTRTQCPANYRSGAAASSESGCKTSCAGGTYVATAEAACTSVGTGYYRAAHTVNYGSTSTRTQCPANYRSGAAASSESGCKTSCAGGTYVATAEAACTSVGTGYYRAAHTVNYGSTSTRTQCPANYRSGAAASSESGCKTSCAGGTYVATAEAACTSVGTGYYRAAHSVSYGSTSTRNTCPSGYPNSDAGAAAITSCYSNSKSRAWTGSQVNGSVPNNCSAVTEWGTCSGSACTYVAYSNSAGTGDGTIKSGCSTNNGNCTKTPAAVTAKAGYYDNGTSCSACPTGYPNSDAGNEGGITKCYSNTKSRPWGGGQISCATPTGCSDSTCNTCTLPACSYVAYSNSTGSADGTIKSGCSTNSEDCQQTVKSVTAKAGRYVSGITCPACAVGTFQGTDDSTATSCTVCAANTYAASTGMSACTACPSGYSTSGTAASNHDAKSDCSITCAAGTRVVTADAACTTPTGSWYTASHSVAAGSTTPAATVKACLTNYSTPNTTTRTDHDASTDCKISCAAGTRVATENATSCTTPAGNWYVGAHSVAQGSISSYSNCLTNYTISGTAAANHDTASDCKISCGGGSYIATANNTTCSDVGAGYWAAASTVSQGSAGVRNACDDGLTTIGSGAGADEVGDCGRVLNVNGEKIYLRSERKTTPSLNVSINGTTFYGNMGASGIGALKLNSGGTTYSVYDDSME